MALSINTRPSRPRADVPEKRDDFSASSVKLIGRRGDDYQKRLAEYGRGHDVK